MQLRTVSGNLLKEGNEMRKLVVLGTVVMMTGVANAEFDIDFEDVSKPKKIDDLIRKHQFHRVY